MNCGQYLCDNVATHKVYWPGSTPVYVCKSHAVLAQEIANTLGLTISIKEIHDDQRIEKTL